MRLILNLEMRLRESDEASAWGDSAAYDLALMWGDHTLRSWPVDSGMAYMFQEKDHQFHEFVAGKLAECLGGTPASSD